MTDFKARRRMMVDTQVRPSDVTKYPIIEALLAVRREVFVPAASQETAYVGENIPLSADRVVLEPRTLAKMLDALDLQPDEMVLDVAAGLGYGAAVMGRLAEAVIALEDDATRAAEAEALLAAEGADNVAVVAGGLIDGGAKHGPYDAILIEGAIETLPPALEAQLKEGGRIAAIFQEGQLGVVRLGYKLDGAISWRFAFNAGAPVLPGFAKTASFAL